MSATPQQLFDVVDATWPAAERLDMPPWTLRRGAGGGKRVSAATANSQVTEADITQAEADMVAMGQTPLFMIRDSDSALDAALAQRAYAIVDPVVVLSCPIAHLTDVAIPRLTTFVIWEPLAIMEEIWAQGGIGPARIDVMRRAKVKTAILARENQKPAGTAFVGLHSSVAMVHAVEVLPTHRRKGLANWMMRRAALWAKEQGAQEVAVLSTRANTAALGLYSGLGFRETAQYHYRQKTDNGDPENG
ncbi:MAG: GNAT family N-acetyltransferase [Roseobacter sp.]|nr:GNAT family N-acetyltransferase [Roseobacter sp.]